ncbi:MAG: pyridoxal phosphate-dependent aminotransferase [Treponema sp.]|nr:pyridoxal phosphate-dependent aminotransferase [Treponema sp.]MCL2238254.1 pyridoxal phosphate-dependent aminotransferase [Treponema sp.]
MKFDFDTIIERKNTNAIKYDPISRGKPQDVLPLWVADMDFSAPPCVEEAITKRAMHGIYGYSEPGASYYTAVQNWFKNRFDWNTEKEWLLITPGVVNALYLAVRAFTNPGDAIVIQQPVYYPFASSVQKTGRTLLVNELVYKDGFYTIDFEDFETQIKQAKLFILCSPHNPAGRVWTRDELIRMGEICLRYGVKVIADEIHQDIIFSPNKHLVFAKLDDRFADITITCTAPSKTFNLAGLNHANIFIENEKLRSSFKKEYEIAGLSQPNIMGLISCEAAYTDGEPWLSELINYLADNMTLIDNFLKTNIPKIKLVKPQGTYLAWLDFKELGLSSNELNSAITQKCKLWLNDGPMFGKGGSGFQRMNAACPRSILQKGCEALLRLRL